MEYFVILILDVTNIYAKTLPQRPGGIPLGNVSDSSPSLPFKISVLVFLRGPDGRLLMIQRRKSPNFGCWSPIGGKLEMAMGESPFECAVREVDEEVRLKITTEDLHLFGYVSEKGFEGNGHWLMFLFDCKATLPALPAEIDEGRFAFFTRDEINEIKIPATDHQLVWPYYDSHRERFVALRADCHPERDLEIVVEQSI
ncbi:NUDIX hydrolase [Cerasicoccus maritimus]|uniref:NUDIX hydrolase n=1 Tax=Cerasicoccus maritimus TaxID=490089 RepID=UPI0028527039|nr:NUDIX domain-containing protein [Cerasicoccus maritimus]